MAVYVCTRQYVYRLTPEPFLNHKMEEAPSFLEENYIRFSYMGKNCLGDRVKSVEGNIT